MDPLGSRYLLDAVIGRGGFGQVWRAQDHDGRAFAVKVLRSDLGDDPAVVARFVRERSLVVGISNPHLVQVRDLVVEGATMAIVMDLVDGPDLQVELNRRGTFPPAEALRITAAVCRGLAAVHAQGIVHRDIKPSNILMAGTGAGAIPKITDFGIGWLYDEARVTSTSSVIGTPEYMAPEYANGATATPAVDVYAAGIMLYQLLCGVTPFAGGNPIAVLNRHVGHAPGRPAGMPEPMWELLAQLLAKEPNERPTAALAAVAMAQLAEQVTGQDPGPRLAAPPGSMPLAPADPTNRRMPSTDRPAATDPADLTARRERSDDRPAADDTVLRRARPAADEPQSPDTVLRAARSAQAGPMPGAIVGPAAVAVGAMAEPVAGSGRRRRKGPLIAAAAVVVVLLLGSGTALALMVSSTEEGALAADDTTAVAASIGGSSTPSRSDAADLSAVPPTTAGPASSAPALTSAEPTPMGGPTDPAAADAPAAPAAAQPAVTQVETTVAETAEAEAAPAAAPDPAGAAVEGPAPVAQDPRPPEAVLPPSSLPAPTISTATLPDATLGRSYSATLQATGTPPLTWTVVAGRPFSGMNLSSSGTLTGSPTGTGTAAFTVKVTDGNGLSDSRDFTITAVRLRGDATGDGQVDCGDVNVLRANYGQPGTVSQGDVNGDGKVDVFDLSIMSSSWTGATSNCDG